MEAMKHSWRPVKRHESRQLPVKGVCRSMKHARISVVVPVYKVEKYLDRCVNSIVSQTYRNLEIILVDDGSPDACPGICDAWAERDSRIRVIHKENAGAGMARNSGIEAATGEYICFVDSDDYLDLTAMEKAHEALTANDAQIVVFGLTRVDARGNPVRQIVPITGAPCYRGDAVQSVFLPDLIDPEHASAANRDLTLSNWSAMYSMELIRSVNWRFVSEREMLSEDSYSLIWLYRHVSSVAVLPEALYFYCENGASLTQTYQKQQFQKVKHFHTACTEMAVELGFGKDICLRISGLFLAFSIATMKQIVAAEMPVGEKKRLLREIIADDTMQTILADPDCRYHSRFRSILFWAMRHRLYGLVYCFVKLQVSRSGR